MIEGKGKEEDKAHSRRTFFKRAGAVVAAGAGAALAAKFFSRKEETPTVPEEREAEKSPQESVSPIEEGPSSVEKEIAFARNLVEAGKPEDFLKSPYLVHALYYSQGFLQNLSRPENKKVSKSLEIISGIKDLVTPELRKQFMEMLDAKASSTLLFKEIGFTQIEKPLAHLDFGKGMGHLDAIDLFIKEGSPVKAISGGIVVLAESLWKEEEPFGTSSSRCGNGVIIYRPHEQMFYRYCHLDKVRVEAGDHVLAGTVIGTVGHSGENASQKGHGGHLHLEINRYNTSREKMEYLTNKELRKMLEGNLN